jgi:hypothetical protein
MLKFWLPIAPECEREILLPPEAVDVLLRAAVHEAAHAEVALHFQSSVRGVAIALYPLGLKAMALYVMPDNLPTQDACTIYGAGSAGELLQFGEFSETSASDDRRAVEHTSTEHTYDVFVQRAKSILLTRQANFSRIATLLRHKFFATDQYLTVAKLPNGLTGAFVLEENELLAGAPGGCTKH